MSGIACMSQWTWDCVDDLLRAMVEVKSTKITKISNKAQGVGEVAVIDEMNGISQPPPPPP